MNQDDIKQLTTLLGTTQDELKLTREFFIERSAVNTKKRTVQLSFSSEEPVTRGFGQEVLDHSPGAVNLARLTTGGALLVNHDNSQQVGKIESASISNRRGLAIVRFGKSALADEIFNDVADGIRSSVSVGYMIQDAEREQDDVFRVTKWEPYEISLVSVPADASVGVGRSIGNTMSTITETNTPQLEERNRVMEITRMGKKHNLEAIAEKSINDGLSLDKFRVVLLEQLNTRSTATEVSAGLSIHDNIDLNKFSLSRILLHMAGDNSIDVGFEREVSQELSSTTKKHTVGGFLVPMGALAVRNMAARDIDAATNHAAMIGIQHLPSQFIDLLRNHSIVARVAPTIIDGLISDVSVPRQSGAGSAIWLDLDGKSDIPMSTQTFDAVPLKMKTLAGLSVFTHRMLKQATPGIENLISRDLLSVVAGGIDKAAIAGAGTDAEPRGVVNTTGIAVGTFAGEAPTFSDVVGMEGLIAASSSDIEGMAYLAHPTLAASLKKTPKDPGSGDFVWESPQIGEGMVNGHRALYSASIPENTILFGNWGDLMIGQWGVLELDTDAGGTHFTKGNICVRVITDIDVAVRHPQSFCVYTKAA